MTMWRDGHLVVNTSNFGSLGQVSILIVRLLVRHQETFLRYVSLHQRVLIWVGKGAHEPKAHMA